MSPRLPIGVATICRPKSLFIITTIFIFIISCTPVNLTNQTEQKPELVSKIDKKKEFVNNNDLKSNEVLGLEENSSENKRIDLIKDITILFSTENKKHFINQFINILEVGIYNKNLQNVSFKIEYFKNTEELENIILKEKKSGKIFIGPIGLKDTQTAKTFCDNNVIFFSFSSMKEQAGDCIYLLNFFPKNELEQLFKILDKESKVALLYPENEYGYMINSLIDDVINKTEGVLVNRASYKNDLSNVRDAIKELGKYELRKYELNRQKKILSSKDDKESKIRLKKLKKFKTTSDYDFTHILLADYGLNLLQVAPLLPYYDIDPNIVQFLGMGVIDDENFFSEPSLQGTIFAGVEKNKREDLILQYEELYDEKLLRVSTLPFDLLGLLNYVFTKNFTINDTIELLNSSKIKFDGIDGKFYFKNNIIERELQILEISNGLAKKIN